MTNAKKEGIFTGQNLVEELREFLGKKVNVEFECGKSIKRATGGTLVEVGVDFIQLNGNITITIVIPGISRPIIKRASIVVIPLVRVCDVEIPVAKIF